MAGRYLVTGVQLGMLVGLDDRKDREDLTKHIEEKQYVGNSTQPIEKDCKNISINK